MGIKYFFAWVQKNFNKNIYPLKKGETILNRNSSKKTEFGNRINNSLQKGKYNY